jgi:hypothetical protein
VPLAIAAGLLIFMALVKLTMDASAPLPTGDAVQPARTAPRPRKQAQPERREEPPAPAATGILSG